MEAYESKTIPILKGYDYNIEDYTACKGGRIIRLGLHVNCPPCNLSCPYCLNSDGVHYINKIENDKAASIAELCGWIDQAKELDVKCVIIDGIYEPLSNKETTLKIIEHINKLSITPILITNTLLLTEKVAIKLKNMNVSILGKLNLPIVNADHPMYTTYSVIQNKLTGNIFPDVYEKLKYKLNMLMELGFNESGINQHGMRTTRMGVETVVVKDNYEFIPEMAAQLRKWNIYLHAELVKPQGAAANSHFEINSEELLKLNETIQHNDSRMGFETESITPAYLTGRCLKHRGTININVNGDVIPCPSVETVVGNLRRQTMRSIINSNNDLKVLRNLEQHIQGDCKNCKLFHQKECYGGCRGYAYMYMRQKGYSHIQALTSSDPSCWNVERVL